MRALQKVGMTHTRLFSICQRVSKHAITKERVVFVFQMFLKRVFESSE